MRYETDLGPVSLSGYGAVSESRAEHKRPGQEGTSDLGAGLKADYDKRKARRDEFAEENGP